MPHSTEDACRLLRGFANGLVDPMYRDANGACAFLKPDGCPNGQLAWSHVAFPAPGMAVSASKGVLYNRTERLPLRVDGEADGTGVVLDSQTVAIAGKRYGIQDDESAGACVAQQQDERCSVWSAARWSGLRQPDHGRRARSPSGYVREHGHADGHHRRPGVVGHGAGGRRLHRLGRDQGAERVPGKIRAGARHDRGHSAVTFQSGWPQILQTKMSIDEQNHYAA